MGETIKQLIYMCCIIVCRKLPQDCTDFERPKTTVAAQHVRFRPLDTLPLVPV